MKINKLKAISIAACCFVISLWSGTQGMDSQNDILESATVNRTSNIKPVSQSEINDVIFETTLSKLINLENFQATLVSYLTYPAELAIQGAYNIIDFTKNHPALAMTVLLTTSFSIVDARTTATFCWGPQIKIGDYFVCFSALPNVFYHSDE